jgi:competence protein ComEC
VVNRFEIGQILTGEKVEGWEVFLIEKGQRIILDDVSLDILWPDAPQEGNSGSVVVRLTYYEAEFLLTGDIEAKIEKQLIVPQTDVLKVAHHGSKTSSCREFIEKVRPKISVISVGENNYGHPHEKVLERLKNTLIYRTDERGDIKMKTDGFTLEVIAKKSFLD